MSGVNVLISRSLLYDIVQPHLAKAAPIAAWFQEGQNRDENPIVPFATVTTMAAVEADAKASRNAAIVNALQEIRANLVAGKRFKNIDRSISERFGDMLLSLAAAGIADFDTLDILDAATASDVGCIFVAPKSKALTEIERVDGLKVIDPWSDGTIA